MTASLVPTGTGTANVLMVNNGFLGLSTKADWYDTAETDDINPPVMCFVIQKDGKNYLWDLGMRPDTQNIGAATQATWTRCKPDVRVPLPSGLPEHLTPSAVYLSHYHWDHCGDVTTVPASVPIHVGTGSVAGIKGHKLGKHSGPADEAALARLSELPPGTVKVDGFPDLGVDVFHDGSFVVVPAPGHCPGHSIAVVRVQESPDAYIILGGDSGHHRAIYDPCPCHGAVADFSVKTPIHQDAPTARKNIERLGGVHARDDVWVILAHETEAVRAIPEMTWLADWREKGWKDKVAAQRKREVEGGCFAEPAVGK